MNQIVPTVIGKSLPTLPLTSLSAEAHAHRATGLGGTDAKRIMDGDWRQLWLEKTGRAEREDLTRMLRVQLGIWTEAFNLAWYQQETGKQLMLLPETVRHPDLDYMLGDFDAFKLDPHPVAVVDAKHTNTFSKPENLIGWYSANMHHYMLVAQLRQAELSVIFGNDKHEVIPIPFDQAYADRLIEMEAQFWWHVVNDKEPQDMAAIAAEVPVEAVRTADMSKSNVWVDSAKTWLQHRDAVKAAEAAESALKGSVEADVKIAYGAGVAITKDKAGKMKLQPLDAKLAKKLKLPEA